LHSRTTVLVAGYVVAVVTWLAWHGLTLRRVELPGGLSVETPQHLALRPSGSVLSAPRSCRRRCGRRGVLPVSTCALPPEACAGVGRPARPRSSR